jgi:hypothetical protein
MTESQEKITDKTNLDETIAFILDRIEEAQLEED